MHTSQSRHRNLNGVTNRNHQASLRIGHPLCDSCVHAIISCEAKCLPLSHGSDVCSLFTHSRINQKLNCKHLRTQIKVIIKIFTASRIEITKDGLDHRFVTVVYVQSALMRQSSGHFRTRVAPVH